MEGRRCVRIWPFVRLLEATGRSDSPLLDGGQTPKPGERDPIRQARQHFPSNRCSEGPPRNDSWPEHAFSRQWSF